jgi:phage protein D
MAITRDAPVYTVKIGSVIQTATQGVAGSSTSSGSSAVRQPTSFTNTTNTAGATPAPTAAACGYTFTSVPVDVTERVVSLEFDEDDQKIDEMTLTLNNFDLALFDDPNWKQGNGLLVTWGYAGFLTPTQTLVIQKITGSIVMKVVAHAMSATMNKIKQSQTFENMKRSDIVSAIAKANGFASNAQFVDDSEVMISATHQARMTDFEFLQHLAKREGFVFYVGPDGLHWERRKTTSAPTRRLIYYVDPGAGDILTWNLENDVTALPGAVQAVCRDPLEKSTIRQIGSNTDTDRTDTAPEVIASVSARTGVVSVGAPGATTSPPAVPTASPAVTRFNGVVVDPATPTAASAIVLSNAPNAAAAKREADGKYVKSQQVAAHITLECVGDPTVRAKQILDIQGISKRLSGLYYCKKAKHKVTASGYTMSLACVTNGLNGGPGTQGVKSDKAVNEKSPKETDQLNPYQVSGRTGEVTYQPDGGNTGT